MVSLTGISLEFASPFIVWRFYVRNIAVIDNPSLDKAFYQLIREGLLQAEKEEKRQRKRESYQRKKPRKKKNKGYRM